jgi:hypothetical protein
LFKAADGRAVMAWWEADFLSANHTPMVDAGDIGS